MVPPHILDKVNLRLNQILKPLSSTATFGNIPVIVLGDYYQLAPVCASPLLFHDPGSLSPSLWDQFSIYTLTEIMRQKDDLDFALLLNRIRTLTKEDQITQEDEHQLIQRCSTKYNPDPTVLRLYATNKEVDEYNKKRMTAFTSTITLVAHDTTTTMKGKTRIEQAPIQFHASEGCMLPETLTVAVDSRIMVIANVDVTGKNTNMLFTKFQHTHYTHLFYQHQTKYTITQTNFMTLCFQMELSMVPLGQ